MARKPKPQAPEVQSGTDMEIIESRGEAMAELAVANTEADHKARAVAKQLGYTLPADCTDPDILQRDIAANLHRSVESCLEAGKGLAVLKEACGHGNFMARLDALGIENSIACRFMKAASKFSNLATSQDLPKTIGNQGKLFELLILDDDQVTELAETGETAGITLDDIECMTVRELRTALRDARDDAKAKEEVLSKKSDIINKLQTERTKAQQRIARETPDETIAALRQDATVITNEVLGMVRGNFRHALQTVSEESDEHLFLAGLVGEVAVTLAMLREEFNLPDVSDARELELIRETAKWAPNAQTSAEPTQDPEDAKVVEAQE